MEKKVSHIFFFWWWMVAAPQDETFIIVITTGICLFEGCGPAPDSTTEMSQSVIWREHVHGQILINTLTHPSRTNSMDERNRIQNPPYSHIYIYIYITSFNHFHNFPPRLKCRAQKLGSIVPKCTNSHQRHDCWSFTSLIFLAICIILIKILFGIVITIVIIITTNNDNSNKNTRSRNNSNNNNENRTNDGNNYFLFFQVEPWGQFKCSNKS